MFDGVPCPLCGDSDGALTLDLRDGDSLHCGSCDAGTSISHVRAVVAGWPRALARLNAMQATTTTKRDDQ